MSDSPNTTTDFGFRTVPRAEKAALVRAVFTRVAPRYDIMNDLMSLGLHRLWKRIFVNAIACSGRETLLDLAAGTGDIALLAKEKGAGRVILSDINPAMVTIARRRALDRGWVQGVDFVVADAERLPLPDCCVEKVSIAFGLRNCTDKAAVLSEAWRVLRPGGRFHCLEFSRLEIAPLLPLYDAWSFRVLPALGACIAKDRAAYEYLAESIRVFPDQETLATMLRDAGFAKVTVRNLTGGIVAIHTGYRL